MNILKKNFGDIISTISTNSELFNALSKYSGDEIIDIVNMNNRFIVASKYRTNDKEIQLIKINRNLSLSYAEIFNRIKSDTLYLSKKYLFENGKSYGKIRNDIKKSKDNFELIAQSTILILSCPDYGLMKKIWAAIANSKIEKNHELNNRYAYMMDILDEIYGYFVIKKNSKYLSADIIQDDFEKICGIPTGLKELRTISRVFGILKSGNGNKYRPTFRSNISSIENIVLNQNH